MQRVVWQRWPLAMTLTFIITTMIVVVVVMITLLFIGREQDAFRAELQQQMILLLGMMEVVTEDELHALDADALSYLMAKLGEDGPLLVSGRIYDQEGRIIADAFQESVTFPTEPDPFGAQLLLEDRVVFEWEAEQLLAGKAVFAGRERLGAISLGLPTAPLADKIAAARTQGVAVAVAAVVMGVVLALLLSRSITIPLQTLAKATQQMAEGDLTQRIVRHRGENELALLSGGMEHMRLQLLALYQGLAERTAELEERNEQLRQEIIDRQHISASLAQAQEQLLRQEKLAFLGQLAGSVGHELRNPMGVITNAVYFLKTVLNGCSNEQVAEYLAIIDAGVHESDKIVTEMLGLSRNYMATRRPTAVSDLIGQLVRHYPPPDNMHLSVSVADDLPTVMIDGQQIGQVLGNLVTNAYQAMRDGDVVHITALAEEAYVCLKICDTGSGMPANVLANIFEPLFSTKVKGFGLGLAVSKNLVKLNQGDIKVTSRVGEGTTFVLRLPLNAL